MTPESPIYLWKRNIPPSHKLHQIALQVDFPLIGQRAGFVYWNRSKKYYEWYFGTVVGEQFHIYELLLDPATGRIIRHYIRRMFGIKHFPNLVNKERREKTEKLFVCTKV